MRAARWDSRDDVRVEEIPEPPAPPPCQVQIEVAWCGICGTDLREITAGPLCIPIGAPHPLTGVVACQIVGCGECPFCRAGAMGQCDRVAFLGHSWSSDGFAERAQVRILVSPTR